MKNKWSTEDKQAFAEGNRQRAQTIPAKKKPAPDKEEWQCDVRR